MEACRKRILLISHEMTYTGAPKGLLEIAKVLVKNDYSVDVWTYRDGAYKENFVKQGLRVSVVDEYEAFANEEKIIREIAEYDLVICNTIRTYAYENICKQYVPTIWLIMEAQNIDTFVMENEDIALALRQKHNVYVVSEYAQEYLKKTWNCESKVIHNCVLDQRGEYLERCVSDKIVHFISVGVVDYRKAYDILLAAYNGLDEELKLKSMLHIIGKMTGYSLDYERKIRSMIESNDRVRYYGEIADNQKVLEKIAQSDVAVIVSRDESCSLVALEAAMLGIPIIVSENVGAKYLVETGGGWKVSTGAIEPLKDLMEDIIQTRDLSGKKKEIRENYLKTSTYDIFEANVLQMIDEKLEMYQSEDEATDWEGLAENKWKNMWQYLSVEMGIQNSASRVIMYGAGEHAKYIYPILSDRTNWKVVAWVDKNFDTCTNDYMPIVSPEKIKELEYDYIFVAVINKDTFHAIKKMLKTQDVEDEKIVWLQWRGRLA